jgi:hypothetical protein
MVQIKNFGKILCGMLLLVSMTGCIEKDLLVKAPDAPMLIQESKGGYIRIAIYNSEENTLVDYGWIKVRELKGWTLSKYDWESFLKEH